MGIKVIPRSHFIWLALVVASAILAMCISCNSLLPDYMEVGGEAGDYDTTTGRTEYDNISYAITLGYHLRPAETTSVVEGQAHPWDVLTMLELRRALDDEPEPESVTEAGLVVESTNGGFAIGFAEGTIGAVILALLSAAGYLVHRQVTQEPKQGQ